MADDDKKGPSKQDVRNMERFRRHTEVVTRLNKTNQRIREQEVELGRESTADTERARGLISEIAKLRQEQLKYSQQEQKVAKELEKSTSEQATHMASFVKSVLKVEKAQDAINGKFGKQLKVVGELATEVNSWVGGLQKGVRVLDEITNPKSQPTSLFARVGKMFYGDVQRASKQHLALQDQLRLSAETTTSAWVTAGLSATRAAGKVDWTGFDKATKSNVSGATAAILDRTEANQRLSEMVNKSSMDLGADPAEMNKFAGDLAAGAQLDVIDPKARKAVADFTREVTYMKETGIIPATMEAEEFVKMTQKFGTSGTAGLEKLRKDFRFLSTIPVVLVKNLKGANNELGRFVATNSQELVKAVMDLNNAIGGQSTNLQNLGTMYASMAVKAKEYGASATNAMKISEAVSKGLFKNDMSVDVYSQTSGEKLSSDILKDKKVAREMAVEMVNSEGKPVTEEEIKKKIDLMTQLAKEGGISHSMLDRMASTTTRGMESKLEAVKQVTGGLEVGTTSHILNSQGIGVNEAEVQAILSKMLTGAGSTKDAAAELKKLKDSTKNDTTVLADDDSGVRKTQEELLLAAKATENPLQQLFNIEKWSARSVGLLTAIAAAGALSGAAKLISMRNAGKASGMGRFGGGGSFAGGDGGGGGGRSGKGIGKAAGDVAEDMRTSGAREIDFDAVGKKVGQVDDVAKKSLSQRLVDLGKKEIKLTPEGGFKASAGRGIASGKNAVMSGLKGAKDTVGSSAKSFMSTGDDMLKSIKGMSKFGKAFGALGVGIEAASIFTDDETDGTTKAARTGDMVAETILSAINPVALGAVMARSAASIGARATGNDEAADWIDNNVRFSALGEGLGKMLADWTLDGAEVVDKSPNSIAKEQTKTLAPEQKALVEQKIEYLDTARVAPAQNRDTKSSAGATGKLAAAAMGAAASQAGMPESLTGQAISTTMISNPDGSTKVAFDLTLPGFTEAVYQAVTAMNGKKPPG